MTRKESNRLNYWEKRRQDSEMYYYSELWRHLVADEFNTLMNSVRVFIYYLKI